MCSSVDPHSDSLWLQKTLISLDLSHNKISPTGTKAITKGVAKSRGLRRLMLRGNQLGPGGAAQVQHTAAHLE